ncbi:LAFE_0G02190g1_1 [Lachancea fermentati]|uniref:Topoisomerase 1-associated factor 1 n=1 Tax=Lachancea fermentati TaxID=4955 RepID=A0A1G4MGR7_LACFM|nr:LAFE_0G02190g1_1 [Lachancea fermentati]
MNSKAEGLNTAPIDRQLNNSIDEDYPSKILKARIALLSTAIGGPDHSSELDPPPYKLGDDCLACLKDLKRWFKLVDDKQARWDVAAAAAQFNVLTDDLMPILVEWENKSAQATKKARKSGKKVEDFFRNKTYHDKVALNALQLMVLMTWPLILTDQSTLNQVNHYSELKKHQLIYKKAILTVENGKVFKAAIRIALEVIKLDKILRSPKDNVILRLVLNFFRNVVAIEPSEITISSRKSLRKGINSVDMLPPNVSADDVSLNTVVESFERNKVFDFLLTLASSVGGEFDASFINVPLLELIFYLIKNVNHDVLFPSKSSSHVSSDIRTCDNKGLSKAGLELSQLLQREKELKKSVVRNTSTRHSRFGALLSIQTSNHQRLTISGGQDLLSDASALKKLDSRKKWNKRVTTKDETIEGLPSNFLNFNDEINYWNYSTIKIFQEFVKNFIESGFDTLLHSVTDHFTTEDDEMAIVHQIQYLLFYAWFVKYQMLQKKLNNMMSSNHSTCLKDTCLVLVFQLLRKAYEKKIWAVVHAGMIAFVNLLSFINSLEAEYEETTNYVQGRLFTDDKLLLLSSLPKTASNHSPAYIKSCINLTHVLLKSLNSLKTEMEGLTTKNDRATTLRNHNITEEEVVKLAQEEGIEFEEALETLASSLKQVRFNFNRVQRAYMAEGTIKTYMVFLHRFKELSDEDIKRAIQFLHHVFVLAKEESLLFRIDFLILLKDLLSPEGLPKQSRSRKHVSKFAHYFMLKLKERLQTSPSWYVSILFPTLNDKEVTYYQKYGKVKTYHDNISENGAVEPSIFKTSLFDGMNENIITDFKFGILVSTLIDDEKIECIEELITNLKRIYDIFHSWLLQNVATDTNENSSICEPFQTAIIGVQNALLSDSDFRALLKLIGFQIPLTKKDRCILPISIGMQKIELALSLIVKYHTTTFDTPNKLPSSTYLVRPEKATNANASFTDSVDFIDNSENLQITNNEQEDFYFQELGTSSIDAMSRHATKGTAVRTKTSKGKAKSKKKNSQRKRSSDGAEKAPDKGGDRHVIISKEFVSDSDDSDDEAMSPIFFENEMYLRWLLDKHGGLLPDAKYEMFARFCAERTSTGGNIGDKYTDLFDGPTPAIQELKRSESLSDRSLTHILLNQATTLENHSLEISGHRNKARQVSSDASNDLQLFESSDESEHLVYSSRDMKNADVKTLKQLDDDAGKNDETDEDDESMFAPLRKKSRVVFIEDED